MRRRAALFAWLFGALTATGAVPPDIDELVALYQDLHRHPELAFAETRTAGKLATRLEACGIEVTRGVGGTGVVGELRNGEGPVLLFRAELDALPLTEKTQLEYASETPGVMHACGHDLHLTALVGAACRLAESRGLWSGTILFVGQPAEERTRGARALLDDGLYTRFPKPDFALALHSSASLETGRVGYHSGPTLAMATAMDVWVQGHGGHGAEPQSSVDPVVLASALVLDLQTLVSRESDPLDPAVVTVGSIHGGTKYNLIPDEVHLRLTLRAFSPSTLERLIASVRRHARGLAEAHGAPAPRFAVRHTSPALQNDPALVGRLVPALARALGKENVVQTERSLASEDFGEYGEGGVPVFQFGLGTIAPERLAKARESHEGSPPLHSSLYFPDARAALQTGVEALTAAALELLPPKPAGPAH